MRLKRILLHCPALTDPRSKMISFWSAFLVSRQRLLPTIHQFSMKDNPFLPQFLLDPISLRLVISTDNCFSPSSISSQRKMIPFFLSFSWTPYVSCWLSLQNWSIQVQFLTACSSPGPGAMLSTWPFNELQMKISVKIVYSRVGFFTADKDKIHV